MHPGPQNVGWPVFQNLAEFEPGKGYPPPAYDRGNPRGEAVVVMGLAVLNPWLASATTTSGATMATTDAAAVVVIVSLEAQVGSLYRLQVLASQLVPKLCRPGRESAG